MKYRIAATACLMLQIVLIMFSVQVINAENVTEDTKLFHFGLIILNVVFGGVNIKTIFSD